MVFIYLVILFRFIVPVSFKTKGKSKSVQKCMLKKFYPKMSKKSWQNKKAYIILYEMQPLERGVRKYEILFYLKWRQNLRKSFVLEVALNKKGRFTNGVTRVIS